jgi:hypothetical protein
LSGPKRHRRFAWIGTLASILIFAVSVGVLWHLVSEVDPAEFKDAFTRASARRSASRSF